MTSSIYHLELIFFIKNSLYSKILVQILLFENIIFNNLYILSHKKNHLKTNTFIASFVYIMQYINIVFVMLKVFCLKKKCFVIIKIY